jgi:hypothetical protein
LYLRNGLGLRLPLAGILPSAKRCNALLRADAAASAAMARLGALSADREAPLKDGGCAWRKRDAEHEAQRFATSLPAEV